LHPLVLTLAEKRIEAIRFSAMLGA
jgi:hypothetical protein